MSVLVTPIASVLCSGALASRSSASVFVAATFSGVASTTTSARLYNIFLVYGIQVLTGKLENDMVSSDARRMVTECLLRITGVFIVNECIAALESQF